MTPARPKLGNNCLQRAKVKLTLGARTLVLWVARIIPLNHTWLLDILSWQPYLEGLDVSCPLKGCNDQQIHPVEKKIAENPSTRICGQPTTSPEKKSWVMFVAGQDTCEFKD